MIRALAVRAESGPVVSVVGPERLGQEHAAQEPRRHVLALGAPRPVGDRDVTEAGPRRVARAGVGYVPQVDDVFAPLRVRENLEMGGYLLPEVRVAARIEHVLAVFPRLGTMLGRRPGSSAAASARCSPWAGC